MKEVEGLLNDLSDCVQEIIFLDQEQLASKGKLNLYFPFCIILSYHCYRQRASRADRISQTLFHSSQEHSGGVTNLR